MNRLANENDIAQIGAKEGDVIIDSPNRKDNSVVYYFMGREWPMLTGKPTVWFDGNKLGFLNEIKFQNTVNELPWSVDDVEFRNVPGTRVKFKSLSCKGLLNFSLDGGTRLFNWPGVFLTGKFGFHAIQGLHNGHGYNISVRQGGSISMKGFESQHGFSGVRLQEKNEQIDVDSLILEDFYIHDTCTGEPIYIGSTQPPPIPRFRKVRIRNFVGARGAAEILQLQHMAGSDVSNLILFAADTSWLNGFQPNQDKGIQMKAGGGINKLRNTILDGFAAQGFIAFSYPLMEKEEINQVLLEDVLFYNGRGAGAYFHSDCKNGIEWRFKNVYYGGFNGSYYDTGSIVRPLFSGAGSDKVVLERLIHDGSKAPLFDDESKYQIGEIIQQPIAAPIYKNSGFHEPSCKIMQWKSHYAKYFGGQPITFKAGDIAIDIGTSYEFYKCLQDSTERPSLSAHYIKLTWDENGVRSDQPGFTTSYSDYPPDDLRVMNYPKMGVTTKNKVIEEYYLNEKRITVTELGTYEN